MNTEPTHQIVVIPEELADLRLDAALARLLPDYSRTQLKEWIESGQITLNGATTKAKTKVNTGDTVSVTATPKPAPDWHAEEIPLQVIYEDEAVLVINKPVGLVVHPGAGNPNSTLLNALLHHAPELKHLPRAGILHRLDKNTSGLLIIAKTAPALKNLSSQLKKRTLSREYQAVVYGGFISGGKIDAPIDRHPLQRKRMAVVDNGKPAITHYRIMEKYRGTTRLKVKLETGRTHQIRVHMAHIRHPLVGDPIYGGRMQRIKGMSEAMREVLRQFKRQALHAYMVGFTHPVTDEWVELTAELPDDLVKLIDALRIDAKRTTS